MDSGWGGGEPRVAEYLAAGLHHLGDEVVSVHNHRTGLQLLGLAAFPIGWDPVAVSHYGRLLEVERPDAVLGFYDYDASLIVAAQRARVPYVCSVHIYWPACPVGTLYIDGHGNCTGPEFGRCLRHISQHVPSSRLRLANASYLPGPLGAQLYSKFLGTRRWLKKADRIVVVGERMKSILMDQGLSHISVINVGISLSEIPAVSWRSGSKTVLMNSGSPIERKGIDHFRKMAEAVQRHRSDATFQATNYAGDSSVTGTQFLDRPALVRLLQRSYMSVLPALWDDPSPLAAIEAMAAGKPVVTYASGGLPEIVDHGVTGLVVPVGDVDSLTSAVDSLLSDEERAGRMGAAGRRRAESLFSDERMVRDYHHLLHEVVESRGGGNS